MPTSQPYPALMPRPSSARPIGLWTTDTPNEVIVAQLKAAANGRVGDRDVSALARAVAAQHLGQGSRHQVQGRSLRAGTRLVGLTRHDLLDLLSYGGEMCDERRLPEG